MLDFEELDYYELLGIERTASADDIKRAFRREMSKYHPDRFVNAPVEQQAYASERSRRITEAHSVLSDFAARSAYNRGQPAQSRSRTTPQRSSVAQPPQQRDHQAELYAKAQEHLQASRPLQAVAVLRELQQINPFYRDSADLLAAAKVQLSAQQQTEKRRPISRTMMIAGAAGGVAAMALIAWAFGQQVASPNSGSAAAPTSAQTSGLAENTATVKAADLTTPTALATALPTSLPTAIPTAIPTIQPATGTALPDTPLPTPEPTLAPTPTTADVLAAQRELLFAESFSNRTWAQQNGQGWSVGYSENRYRISADRGVGTIWSYRTGPDGALSISADVQIIGGEGGLLLWFVNQDNYLSFTIDPQRTSFRLDTLRGGTLTTVAGGQSEAIKNSTTEANRLEARLRGNAIAIVVNGQELEQVTLADTTVSERYGLVAIGGDTPAEALFDNLEIRALE